MKIFSRSLSINTVILQHSHTVIFSLVYFAVLKCDVYDKQQITLLTYNKS